MRKCRNWQTSKTKDLVSIALVWVQVPSSAFFYFIKKCQKPAKRLFCGLFWTPNVQEVDKVCQNSAPFLPLEGQSFCPLRGRILAPHIFQKKYSKIYNIRRKAFTLLRGNSRDCKGFSCLREISCSVLLYQILSHLSSFIVRDSTTDFDITGSSQGL